MATKIGFLEASGSYGRRLLGLRSTACAPSLNLPALGRRHTLSLPLAPADEIE